MRKPRPKTLLTRSDIENLLGCGRTVANRLINAGHFPNAFKFNPDARNSHWRVPVADVDAYIQRSKVQPPRDRVGA